MPRSRLPAGRWQVLAGSALLVLLAVNLAWLSTRSSSMRTIYSRNWRLGHPVRDQVDAPPLPAAAHEAHDAVLRRIVRECAKGEDSTIFLQGWGLNRSAAPQLVVEQGINSGACPPMDIMLGGTERGYGMCTDVALYVMHAGARIIPNMSRTHQYDTWCGPQTARLHLETMYPAFVTRQPGVLHLMLPNSEHLQVREAALHPRIHGYLCKTRFCERLMRRHMAATRARSSVWYMGHSSADPLAGGRGMPWGATVGVPKWHSLRTFLHVKGKSGLKHTTQLLDCWMRHAEWPRLTVVGRFARSSVKRYLGRPNIHFVPEVHRAGQGDEESGFVDLAALRRLQTGADTHICISEREGFGHYLNEARAAGALIITTDHPPMNELVSNASGVLVRPNRTGSHEFMALGIYEDINAFVDADAVCGGVEAALKLNEDQVHRAGQTNRARYLRDEAALLRRMDDLRAFLLRRRDSLLRAEAAAGISRKRQTGEASDDEDEDDDARREGWLPAQAAAWLHWQGSWWHSSEAHTAHVAFSDAAAAPAKEEGASLDSAPS